MRALACSLFLVSACHSAAPQPQGPVPVTPTVVAAPAPSAEASASPAASALAARPASDVGVPCGPLQCLRYPDAATALSALLVSKPQIIGIGEAHALKGAEGVETATSRFERELLPLLARAGASELVVELLAPATNCEKAVTAVKEQQRPVVSEQSQGNQNRFVSLGMASRKLGVVPFLLEPTCEEYKGVISSEDGVTLMLELIAQKTEQRLTRFWRRNQGVMEGQAPLVAPGAASTAGAVASAPPSTSTSSAALPASAAPAPAVNARPDGIVLAYGGAMHNDVESPPDGQNFRYGAHMVQLSQGHYVELDLIVPEYIKDTEVWQALPWYAAYSALPAADGVVLYSVGPYSYTLIFGRSEPGTAAPAAPATAPGPTH